MHFNEPFLPPACFFLSKCLPFSCVIIRSRVPEFESSCPELHAMYEDCSLYHTRQVEEENNVKRRCARDKLRD